MAESNVKQYDLVAKMSPFLDRHMIVRLLEFLEEKAIYPEAELKRAKIEVLSGTNMVDFTVDIYQSLNPNAEVPSELKEKRDKVMEMHKKLNEEVKPVLELANQPEVMKTLKEGGNLNKISYLTEHHGITEATVKALYAWAKFTFECGDYTNASSLLGLFREVSTDTELCTNALWGKLAANILMETWDAALKDFQAVREVVEGSRAFVNPTIQLQQRTWLLHWSLPIFFNYTEGRSTLFEWYNNDRTWSVVQTSCPHVLRYLIVATILSKRRLKDMAKIVDQEAYNYSDPITKFIEALYNQLDFESAEQLLVTCDAILENDPYLSEIKNEFLENARLLIFELFCKLHNSIDTKLLATKLNMSPEDSEKWIVNLIRGAKLDAKIDTQANQVHIGSQSSSLYQQLIDRTRLLMRPSAAVPKKQYNRDNQSKEPRVAATAAASE